MNDIDHVMESSTELLQSFLKVGVDPSLRKECLAKITQYLLGDDICSITASKNLFLQSQLDVALLSQKNTQTPSGSDIQVDEIRSGVLGFFETNKHDIMISLSSISNNEDPKTITPDEVYEVLVSCVNSNFRGQEFHCALCNNRLSSAADRVNTSVLNGYAKKIIQTTAFDQRSKLEQLDKIITLANDCRQVLCEQMISKDTAPTAQPEKIEIENPKPLSMRRP